MEETSQISDIDAVIFDMDGTLVDSEGLAEQLIAAFLRDRGVADRQQH